MYALSYKQEAFYWREPIFLMMLIVFIKIHWAHKLFTSDSFHSAEFPPQRVVIPEVNVVYTAGEMFQLDCYISRGETLPPSTLLEVIWLDNSNNTIISNSNTSITGDTSTTASHLFSQLTFPRIRTSHGGRYTCAVNLTVPEVVTDHRVTRTRTVMVMSKCACCLHVKACVFFDVIPSLLVCMLSTC